MPVSGYVDESGFNPDDMRHPRWLHPIVPENREEPSELERALTEAGIPFDRYGGRDGIRASFDSALLYVARRYVPIWPAKDGKYGCAAAPQYCIRDDGWRGTLGEIVEKLREIREVAK